MRRGVILVSIVGTLVLSSCSGFFLKLYGMKNLKPVGIETISDQAAGYHIPSADSYELDTTFIGFLKGLDTARFALQKKNHSQPLQAMYFNRKGELVSFFVNCYAGGFPNLSWQLTGFVPKTQAPVDSVLDLETQLKYLHPPGSSKTPEPGEHETTVVVYWSRFMGRQSKRFIQAVQDNLKLSSAQNVRMLYVNNDNFLEKAFRAAR